MFVNHFLHKDKLPSETIQLLHCIYHYKMDRENCHGSRKYDPWYAAKASLALDNTGFSNSRVLVLKTGLSAPINQAELELSGYRNLLMFIQQHYKEISIQPPMLCHCYHLLFPLQKVEWKRTDSNCTVQNLPETSHVFALETPYMMHLLCSNLQQTRETNDKEPLLLISTFILDMIFIRPFSAGNGRLSRLLAVLLLYQYNFEVLRRVSLEQIILRTKKEYVTSIQQAVAGWKDNRNNIFPWVHYFLRVLLAAYEKE